MITDNNQLSEVDRSVLLTDILWEELELSLDKRIATLINYISRSYITGSHIKKNLPIKIN